MLQNTQMYVCMRMIAQCSALSDDLNISVTEFMSMTELN